MIGEVWAIAVTAWNSSSDVRLLLTVLAVVISTTALSTQLKAEVTKAEADIGAGHLNLAAPVFWQIWIRGPISIASHQAGNWSQHSHTTFAKDLRTSNHFASNLELFTGKLRDLNALHVCRAIHRICRAKARVERDVQIIGAWLP